MVRTNNKRSPHALRILSELSIRGSLSGVELCDALRITQSTLSRAMPSVQDSVFRYGRARATRYAAWRSIGSADYRFPFFRVSQSGEAVSLGQLVAIKPRGFVWIDENEVSCEYPGIPFFLADVAPQGFLGRLFARRHVDLRFPIRTQDWSEDQMFLALITRGEDLPGDLLVGPESFDRLYKKQGEVFTESALRVSDYPLCAEATIAGKFTGSSAAGEQPKFLHAVREGGEVRKVLVKFSSDTRTVSGRRWGDLLHAEKIALDVLRNVGVPAARSEVIDSNHRVFLESTRFDRVGAQGRRGLVSLAAIDHEWFGKQDSWTASAQRLLERGSIDGATASRMGFLDAFGGLIANSDRHLGNLSFFWSLGSEKLELAPAYDMLPMLFAPVEDSTPEREFVPPPPHADALKEWGSAKEAARIFWKQVSADQAISKEFREIAKQALKSL